MKSYTLPLWPICDKNHSLYPRYLYCVGHSTLSLIVVSNEQKDFSTLGIALIIFLSHFCLWQTKGYSCFFVFCFMASKVNRNRYRVYEKFSSLNLLSQNWVNMLPISHSFLWNTLVITWELNKLSISSHNWTKPLLY